MHFLTTDKYVEGRVVARFAETKKPAVGNMTLDLYFREQLETSMNKSFSFAGQQITKWVSLWEHADGSYAHLMLWRSQRYMYNHYGTPRQN